MKAIVDGKLVDIEINVDPREIALAEIASLKEQLASSDYKAIKFAEGLISATDYEPIKAERQALRDRINELEKLL